MIQSYQRFSIELVFRAEHGETLAQAIKSLLPEWKPLIYTTLASFSDEESALVHRGNSFRKYCEAPVAYPPTSPVVEVIVPCDSADAVGFLELGSLAALGTPFGQDRRGAGNFALYFWIVSLSDLGSQKGSSMLLALRNTLKEKFSTEQEIPASSISGINNIFNDLKTKSSNAVPSGPQGLHAAEMLRDRAMRNLIIRTRQARQPTLENISKSAGIDEAKADEYFMAAEAEGLISRKYDAICKKCGAAIGRCKDEAALRNLVSNDIACPGCGEPVQEGSSRQVIFATESAVNLLDHSTWMSTLVRHYLHSVGIGAENVAIEIQHGPNELDVAVNCDGDLILMELKDAKFSMGHAYSFVGKCSKYKPHVAVIVALDGFDVEVKEYIESTGLKPHYLESLECPLDDFRSVLTGVYSKRIKTLVAKVPWQALCVDSFTSRFC